MSNQPAVEKVKEPCHVAGHGCFNPWGWRGSYGIVGNDRLIAIPLCYRCGDPCCEAENCSSVVPYMGEDRRLCMTCLNEMAREQAV